MMALQQNFINPFQMKQLLSFQMFTTPGESMSVTSGTTSWVLLLEQESYRSSKKKVIKKILETTDPYTTILKNRLQKTFRYYNRLTPVRSYKKQNNFNVHTLSTICDIIDESNKLNKNLSVISIELILSFLLCISSDMETN